MSDLLAEIEDFLARTGTAASTLGRRAVNDPALVQQLRQGRRCWEETASKVRAAMRSIEEERETAIRSEPTPQTIAPAGPAASGNDGPSSPESHPLAERAA